MELFKASSEVKSLVWVGDDLVDIVGGGRRWTPDGVEHESRFPPGRADRLERAVHSPSGRYSVVYEERGTKAVLREGGRVVRELNRGRHHAADSDYPVALAVLRDGLEVLIHCPEKHNVLEIENTASGERLTTGVRDPRDVFHSRLSVSPDGRHLLVAGWVWAPYGIARVFDLDEALADASTLDGLGILPMAPGIDAEVASAGWLDADRLVVAATKDETFDDDEVPDLGRGQMGVWSLPQRRWTHLSLAEFDFGTLIPCGDRVFSLHGHPRLIDVATGSVVAEWPAVPVSRRDGACGALHVPTPVAALHPDRTRLAVAQDGGIAILPCEPAG